MNKIVVILLIGSLFIGGIFYASIPQSKRNIASLIGLQEEIISEDNKEETSLEELITCLKEKGVVIYGSSTCPVCRSLVEGWGGSNTISPIYIDCSLGKEESKQCRENIVSGYVPEIQINGEVFKGGRSPEDLAKETGCLY